MVNHRNILVWTFVTAASFCQSGHAQDDQDAAPPEHLVPLFPAAADERRQGFVRVANHSGRAGEVEVRAFDDDGNRFGPVPLAIGTNETVHFNSADLEAGNAAKGLPEGVGSGSGDWRLALQSGLDIEVLSYVRHPGDGFATSMHDLAAVDGDGEHHVPIFNPASNADQASLLRIVNPGEEAARVTVEGVDDDGEPGRGEVRLTVPARAARTLDALQLEAGGSGVEGSLGDGAGKWRLAVGADRPVHVMSLLRSPAGHLANLSTAPPDAGDGAHAVAMFPAASDPLGRQGFVRVVNRSDEAGEATIRARDDTDRGFATSTLALDAGETAHFNSDDLELGNADKGLAGGTGAGDGDWRLTLESGLDIEVLAYVRTADGFLTAMHDTVPREGRRHRVATFNPGSNAEQASLLRLVNAGDGTAAVTVAGTDDRGARSSGTVSLQLPAGTSRTLSARELEAGGDGFEGALGDGAGKWRLVVESDRPVAVVNLLSSPSGHLANLSTAPAADFAPGDAAVFADRTFGRRIVGGDLAGRADLLAGGRFRETAGSETREGAYTYTRTGRNRATVALDYDDGGGCTYEIVFRSRTAGRVSFTCDDGDDRSGESDWRLDGTPVDIPDANLRTVVERHLGKPPGATVSAREMATLRSLSVDSLGARWESRAPGGYVGGLPSPQSVPYYDHGGIGDLEGIQFAVNLEELWIQGAVWDGPARKWHHLNDVDDLSPLSGLTKLVRLNLGGANNLLIGPRDLISDISVIANLTGLEDFRCWNCNVTDLTPLSGLSRLKVLFLASNDRLRDLAPLSGLTGLVELSVYWSDVRELAPLSNLVNLETLRVSYNPIDGDITPLSGLTKLRVLGVADADFGDLSPLRALTDLEFLEVRTSDIVDIAPLAGMTKLRILWLGQNEIEDLSPLRALPDLRFLDLIRNVGADFGVLAELTRLEVLWLEENRLADLSLLRGLGGLRELRLRVNEIEDLSPLAGLVRLRELDLSYNRIADAAPLLDNAGLGEGDAVDLRENPLSDASVETHIPALAGRGAEVSFSVKEILVDVDDPPTLYRDNVFVLPVADDLLGELRLEEYARTFYEHFEDEFDFLFLVSNLAFGEDRRGYFGRHFRVGNDVRGIGLETSFDESWGSAGRLRSVVHLAHRLAMSNGPTLHETMHAWANHIVDGHSPHWGFASADGQLGGFAPDDLVDLGSGRYTAGDFTLAGYAHNLAPFGPVELYLAGLVGKEDVPDLLVAENAAWQIDDDGGVVLEDGLPVFTADAITTLTIDDMVAAEGERVPAAADARKEFRAAAVLLVDADHPGYRRELAIVGEAVSWFSHPGGDDYEDSYNFHEATGGRATMAMDKLQAFRVPVAQTATVSGTVPQSAKDLVRASLDPAWPPEEGAGRRGDARRAGHGHGHEGEMRPRDRPNTVSMP